MGSNKQTIEEAFAVYNEGDIESYAEFYSDPVRRIDPNTGETSEVSRADGIAEDRTFREVFPDHVCLIQSMVAEGDRVHVRYINEATHTGKNEQTAAFFGEPTGRKVRWAGWSEYRLENGTIVEVAAMGATRHLLQQLTA